MERVRAVFHLDPLHVNCCIGLKARADSQVMTP